MKPEHWRQIERFYRSALKMNRSRREAFLKKACSGDEFLRDNVASLLECQPEAIDFMEAPAIEIIAREMATDEAFSRKLPALIGNKVTHYRIIAELGGGGMGVIYKAEDTKLGRLVAVKFMSEESLRDRTMVERFRSEAKAASALNHPNICTIYEIDEHKGRHFIAMELLEGQTVKERIREKKLGPGEILDFAQQITEGLETAHAKGIIHRDITSANLFVTDGGRVKILDFGLAKLLLKQKRVPEKIPRPSAEAGGVLLTTPGMAMGTVAYMSPEQALGKEVDARTDIFSFGVVLYEMSTGRLPFRGNSPAAVSEEILHRVQTSPSQLNPAVPRELEHIIDKALEKDLNLRYQNVPDLRLDIQRLWRDYDSRRLTDISTPDPSDVRSLAVLPFTNIGGDRDQEYFSDGLAEEIINALMQLPGLRVAARTSSFFFREKRADIREIGTRLNVDNILEGSVRKAGNRIRVTAKLISIADGCHVWSERYDRVVRDIFAVQDEISRAIAEKMRVRLAENGPTVKRYGENLEAYDLCLKARYHLHKNTLEGNEKCRQYCEQALALDPGYALAHARMTEYYWAGMALGFIGSMEASSSLKSAALHALKCDDTLGEAHGALAIALGTRDFDWAGAEREFRRGIELNPASPEVHFYAHFNLFATGRVEESLTEMKIAVKQDPLSPLFNAHLGSVYKNTRQFEQAISCCQLAIELNPTLWIAHWLLALAYLSKGMLDPAIPIAEKGIELFGRNPCLMMCLGAGYAAAGRTSEVRQLLDELVTLRQTTHVSPLTISALHLALGELDEGLQWLATAVEERDLITVISLRSDIFFDPLRSHPAFQALLRRMNLQG